MLKIAILVWMMAGTTLAGIAVMAVLTVPALAIHDMQYLPYAGAAGFLIAVPLAYVVTKQIAASTASRTARWHARLRSPRSLVGAPAVASPATYTYKGKQYVAFVAGGNAILKPQVGDLVVAFALPNT